MSDFDQRAKEECTKNPVFLFQLRQWIYTGLPVYDGEDISKSYNHDGEGIILGEIDSNCHWKPLPDSKYLKPEELEMMDNESRIPCAVETWRTDKVFLTRRAAEDHGAAIDYRHPEGWRVYCVCCDKELADVIRESELVR